MNMKKFGLILSFILIWVLLFAWAYNFKETKKEEAKINISQNENFSSDNFVYITENGEKYHKKSCKRLSENSKEIALETALYQGFEPCSTCFEKN